MPEQEGRVFFMTDRDHEAEEVSIDRLQCLNGPAPTHTALTPTLGRIKL
jgi:hypothetical protein